MAFLYDRFGAAAPLVFTVGFVVWATTFAVAFVFLPLRELRMRTRSRRDRMFADHTPGAAEFAVEVVVRYAGKPRGADRGVVWFENGLLGFTGERTSFLLAYEDLQPPRRWTLTEIDRAFLPLRLRPGNGKLEVAVRPMWGQGWGYRRALRRFLREKAPTEEARQWPPLAEYEPLDSPRS